MLDLTQAQAQALADVLRTAQTDVRVERVENLGSGKCVSVQVGGHNELLLIDEHGRRHTLYT